MNDQSVTVDPISAGGAGADQPRRRRLPQASAATHPITLSDGTVVMQREPNGGDMIDAAMIARTHPVGGEVVVMFALAATVSTLDGEPLFLDEFFTMRAADAGLLSAFDYGKTPGNGAPSSADAI